MHIIQKNKKYVQAHRTKNGQELYYEEVDLF